MRKMEFLGVQQGDLIKRGARGKLNCKAYVRLRVEKGA